MDYQRLLDEIYVEVKPLLAKGKVADYIPALAEVNPSSFGMAVVTLDGSVFSVGDAYNPFSIQSISKVFNLVLAFSRLGDAIWDRVGREPSGNAFNSLLQLEYEAGIPRNPFINAGAIVVADMLCELYPNAEDDLIRFVREVANNPEINYDLRVAQSERETGNRNFALGYFMKSFGNIHMPIERVMDFYFKQCSMSMNCVDLGRSFLMLANHGIVSHSGERVLTVSQTKRLSSLLLTSGLYNEAGEFAFRVGLPAKSGVGGGIAAIIPQKLSVVVWSPGLNTYGNSLAGIQALELFTTKSGISIF
ncbi:glutaminase [Williamwhitmania taraxaci]|uniref:Glutaminase n=1 Tax=Williamwhitmania taraxaci TaxID=1640674 RepID=A0A1G6R959_9BACT|nr:glutaminase [Williamwhitmania taraxaci]SDD00991.1 L-glutaminase [Williamwhitmania taraxaci]